MNLIDENLKIPKVFQKSVCCPRCHGDLQITSSGTTSVLVCEMCQTPYPILASCPILIDESKSVFDHGGIISEYSNNIANFKSLKGWNKSIFESIVSLTPTIYSKKRLSEVADIFLNEINNIDKEIIVVAAIGNGTGGLISNRIKTNKRVIVIESDVYICESCQFVSDIHGLPIKSGSVDVVLLEGVLEHVVDPVTAVEEIHRILCDDGRILVTIPFLLGVHMPVADFTRYSRLGLIRLLKKFRMVECKTLEGSFVALSYQLSYVFMAIASFLGSGRLVSIAKYFGNYLIFWLKYVDRFVRNLPVSQDSAASFYYIGRKSNIEITDTEVNALFEGKGICPK